MSDYQTHVFTSTYTADVSGVCSALYELGGMTVIHDPSGCNSTYSTHDEPRWFDTDSLMFVSGLDEMTAVLGDDNVLIDDVTHAVRDLKPRFVTLCSGSIPHIIAFDCKGVAHLLEKRTGVPMLPVTTTGNRSYVAGVGAALTEWVKRFADSLESPYRVSSSGSPDCSANTLEGAAGPESFSVNLLGVTPLDFSINGNVDAMRKVFEDAGIPVNCCAAMGESFDSLRHIFRASVNVVVSSCGRASPATWNRPPEFLTWKARPSAPTAPPAFRNWQKKRMRRSGLLWKKIRMEPWMEPPAPSECCWQRKKEIPKESASGKAIRRTNAGTSRTVRF